MKKASLLCLVLVFFPSGHSASANGPAEATISAGQSNSGGLNLPNSEPAKPVSRTVRNAESRTVQVDDRLLAPPNDAIGARACRFLESKLADIKAEMTESYFGLNDFFPFNRVELLTAEPEILDLMQTIRGPVAGVQTKSVKAPESPALPTAPGANSPFPDFRTLAEGPQQVRLLPGQHDFVLSMYGAPGDLETLRQLVGVMRERRIGNGFDPGPGTGPASKPIFDYLATVGWPLVSYSGGEMQIKGGRAVLGPENLASLESMDRAGLFTAVQLGEWGYYFHNLANNESWWREVFGREFDAFKHLMKPRGLAGYDRRPAGRRECYDVMRDYFQSRQRDLLGRVISVTGHSHYEAYAGEWGARCIGLEVGENIAFTQSKLAFTRGASRQWQKPWSVQVSPWFSGACTTSGPLRNEGGGVRGLDAGHSLSFYERMWLHGWFAGTAMVTPENSIASFFEKPAAPWMLTSHGRKAVEVFDFMRHHDRGVPYMPVAIVLDHLAGYNAYMDKPWGILEPTAGDREVRDLFDFQLFPGSDHIHTNPFPNNPEFSYLRPTPFGEMFDVLLTSVPPGILASYPVIILAGDIEFDTAFLSELDNALRRGSRLLLSPRHREVLGAAEFRRLSGQGAVEVLEPWTNPVTRRPAAVSNDRLRGLVRQHLPVEVSGDPVQFQVNRTPHGWVVELVNDAGVTKKPGEPAATDAAAVARVRVRPQMPCQSAHEWRALKTHDDPAFVEVELGPGAVEFVELTSAAK